MSTYFAPIQPSIRIYNDNITASIASPGTPGLIYTVPANRIFVLFGFSASNITISTPTTQTLFFTADGLDIYREQSPGNVITFSINQTKTLYIRSGAQIFANRISGSGGVFSASIRGILIGNNA